MFNAEFRDDLPTLLGYSSLKHFKNSAKAAKQSALSVFHEIDIDEGVTKKKLNQIKFVSPYTRYLAMLPFAEKQRLEELAKQEEENKKKRLCPEVNPEEFVSVFVAFSKTFVTICFQVVKTEPTIDLDSDSEQNASKRVRNDKIKPSVNEPLSKKPRIAESSNDDNEQSDNNAKILEDSQPESEANKSDATFSDNPKEFFKSKKDKKRAKKMIQKALKNNKKSMNDATSSNSNQERKEFNYEKVDFSKIQGGSLSHRQQNQNQDSKFKQKVKLNFGTSFWDSCFNFCFHFQGKRIRNDKKFNKMLTFGKGNANKKQK